MLFYMLKPYLILKYPAEGLWLPKDLDFDWTFQIYILTCP